MAVRWFMALRRSDLGVAVFDVVPSYRNAVLAWAAGQDVPTAAQFAVHRPAVQAWAVLDGGITSLEGYGATSLPCGARVVGFQTLRLLLADLRWTGPRPFADETVLDDGELRRAHRAVTACPEAAERAAEQAELLATCHDAVLLRWVAAVLLGARQTGASTAVPMAAARSAR